MDDVYTASGDLLVLNDYNDHFDLQDNPGVKLMDDIISTYNLKQHIRSTTHKKGHILDLVLSHSGEIDVMDIHNHGPIISDHAALSFSLPLTKIKAIKTNYHVPGPERN